MAAIIPSVNLVYYLQPSAGRMTGNSDVTLLGRGCRQTWRSPKVSVVHNASLINDRKRFSPGTLCRKSAGRKVGGFKTGTKGPD
jgi:hypothetical protein